MHWEVVYCPASILCNISVVSNMDIGDALVAARERVHNGACQSWLAVDPAYVLAMN